MKGTFGLSGFRVIGLSGYRVACPELHAERSRSMSKGRIVRRFGDAVFLIYVPCEFRALIKSGVIRLFRYSVIS